MSKQIVINARHQLFLLKVSACFLGLLLGSFVLAPKVSMQEEPEVVMSNSMMNGNYRPTPEPPKSTVRGRVFYEDTGRAVRRASIMLMGKNAAGGGGGREFSGLTDNNGFFQIKNVYAGTYYAFVNAPGVVSPLAFADLSKSKDAGLEEAVQGFQPIVVSGAGDIDVQVPARRGGAISGRIMYADGDAVIGVKVEILRKVENRFVSVIPNFSSIVSLMMGGGGGGFQTDDRGFYRFAGLPAGEYIVKVTENVSHGDKSSRGYDPFGETIFGSSSFLTMFYPDVFTTEKAQTVSIVAGQEQMEINITIPDRDLFAVEGKIVAGKDKSPIKNARIYLKRSGDNVASIFDELSKRQQNNQSDEQGNWSFKELPKGTYKLVVEPPYVGSYEDDPEAYMNNPGAYTGNQNRNPNAPSKPKLAKKIQEITLDDKNLSEIVVELGYGATVSGSVTTENSREMPPNVSIVLSQDEEDDIKSSATIYNAADGEMRVGTNSSKPQKTNYDFKIESVMPGKTQFTVAVGDDDFYVKSAMMGGMDLLTSPLELKEGEMVKNVQIVLSKAVGTLKGKVTDDANQPVKGAAFILVPTDAAKRKNKSFYRGVTTNENGEFELKAAPFEYAIFFSVKDLSSKKGEELDRWLEAAIKDAKKVTVRTNETEKVSLTLPK